MHAGACVCLRGKSCGTNLYKFSWCTYIYGMRDNERIPVHQQDLKLH